MGAEGYLLLATGPARYLAMARNLAASLKVMDGSRPTCLVHDGQAQFERGDAALFDEDAVLEPDERFPGPMNKIRLYPLSPYDLTMVVDVDCLLAKRDVGAYWREGSRVDFLIAGEDRVSGEWKGADVARLLSQEGARYLVQMNSGVFTFRRSPSAAAFFHGLVDFYLRRRDHVGPTDFHGEPAQNDEPYFGLWMGLNGLHGWSRGGDANSWMVSTWRALSVDLDPEQGRAVVRKPRRSIAGVPHPFGGWDRLSPTFVHFIGLKPRRQYDRAAAYFRRRIASASAEASAA